MPSNRVPTLFPEKIGGAYWRLDRPFGIYPGSLWISQSPDLIHWGRHRALLHDDADYRATVTRGADDDAVAPAAAVSTAGGAS